MRYCAAQTAHSQLIYGHKPESEKIDYSQSTLTRKIIIHILAYKLSKNKDKVQVNQKWVKDILIWELELFLYVTS